MPSLTVKVDNHSTSYPPIFMDENHPISSFTSQDTSRFDLPGAEPNSERADSFNMVALLDEVTNESLTDNIMEEEKIVLSSTEFSALTNLSVNSDIFTNFLEPENVSSHFLSATSLPLYRGIQKIQILHDSIPLQLYFKCLKIRFGISTKFVDHSGRPRLNIVVEALPSLCDILDAADSLAQMQFIDSGSLSEWRPVVTRKAGYFNLPTVQLHLQTIADGDTVCFATELNQKDTSSTQKIVFGTFDVGALNSFFFPGRMVDAFFSLDSYNYQQNAGIRLVARKLIVYPAD